MRIVEFGPAENPVFELSETVKEKVESGSTYIGIEINQNSEDIRYRKRTHLVFGDLGRIPLRDETADEIWLLNVFGGEFEATLGINSPDKYFEEMARILKPGGIVYIGEFYYPAIDPNWLKEVDYGKFGLTKQVYEDKNLCGFLEQYGMTVNHYMIHPANHYYIPQIPFDKPPFAIVLTKSISDLHQ